MKRASGIAAGVVVSSLMAAIIAIGAKPPELVRIGASFTAKIVCSNVFLAGRDPAEVLATDVQAPGHPLLRLMRVVVDREHGVVRAGLFGVIGNGTAVARPDVGCAVLSDGKVVGAQAARDASPAAAESIDPAEQDGALRDVVRRDDLAGPGVRAIVVMHEGRVVAERYAAGFDQETPQLGWSMTKSVTAGLIGLLVKDGRMKLGDSAGMRGGGRERITIADLMSMTSGLEFNEGYGAVSDVTRMLYLEPDMVQFAGTKPIAHPAGSVWSYSSGTAVILSRIAQDALGSPAAPYLRARLFNVLGMASAVMETDETGTLVGSSYMYATPRDWARYGQLLAQDGIWQGREILPRGYVAMMASAVDASGGEYGKGMVWRWATHGDKPGVNPDSALGIPADAFWMVGHDGQYVAIIPSRQLVIVRMGLTPSRERYHPEPLVGAVLGAVR